MILKTIYLSLGIRRSSENEILDRIANILLGIGCIMFIVNIFGVGELSLASIVDSVLMTAYKIEFYAFLLVEMLVRFVLHYSYKNKFFGALWYSLIIIGFIYIKIQNRRENSLRKP